MAKLGLKETEYLNVLARLGLSEREMSLFAPELSRIMDFVEQLKGAPVGKLKPTNQVTGLSDVWRQDEVRTCPIPPEKLLANAPMVEDGNIKVRRVL